MLVRVSCRSNVLLWLYDSGLPRNYSLRGGCLNAYDRDYNSIYLNIPNIAAINSAKAFIRAITRKMADRHFADNKHAPADFLIRFFIDFTIRFASKAIEYVPIIFFITYGGKRVNCEDFSNSPPNLQVGRF